MYVYKQKLILSLYVRQIIQIYVDGSFYSKCKNSLNSQTKQERKEKLIIVIVRTTTVLLTSIGSHFRRDCSKEYTRLHVALSTIHIFNGDARQRQFGITAKQA